MYLSRRRARFKNSILEKGYEIHLNKFPVKEEMVGELRRYGIQTKNFGSLVEAPGYHAEKI